MQISANHLKIGYDDKIVVPDFDVVIHKHDITTFIGPNGCGKSSGASALTRASRSNIYSITSGRSAAAEGSVLPFQRTVSTPSLTVTAAGAPVNALLTPSGHAGVSVASFSG